MCYFYIDPQLLHCSTILLSLLRYDDDGDDDDDDNLHIGNTSPR